MGEVVQLNHLPSLQRMGEDIAELQARINDERSLNEETLREMQGALARTRESVSACFAAGRLAAARAFDSGEQAALAAVAELSEAIEDQFTARRAALSAVIGGQLAAQAAE